MRNFSTLVGSTLRERTRFPHFSLMSPLPFVFMLMRPLFPGSSVLMRTSPNWLRYSTSFRGTWNSCIWHCVMSSGPSGFLRLQISAKIRDFWPEAPRCALKLNL
jgi:hypothetical protein